LTFAAISKGVLTKIWVKYFILAIGYKRAVLNCENSGSKTPANHFRPEYIYNTCFYITVLTQNKLVYNKTSRQA